MESVGMRLLCCVLVTLNWVSFNDAAKLPAYLKPCARNDPNFKTCAIKNGQLAISSLLRGDRKYGLPTLDPIQISKMEIDQNGLTLRFTDMDIHGTKDFAVEDFGIDFDKRQLTFKMLTPQAVLLANYTINGILFQLPVTGEGKSNMTLDNWGITFTVNYDLVKKKDGKEYAVLKDSYLDYKVTRVYIRLDNLFNGDKVQGEQMNTFFDENWREMNQELGPPVREGIRAAISQIMSIFMDNFPFEEIFPKT